MLEVITVDEHDKWDEIVKSFSLHDVYYLCGYAKGFKVHGDGEPLLFYYHDENLRGINVVMKRDIADDKRFNTKIELNRYFDFSTPYGYGGWLIEGEGDNQNLFRSYYRWCRENNIVSEFVRYHPILGNATSTDSFYDVKLLGDTIAMDLTSKEIIWTNLTSKNRNMIRKARKSNVKIYHGHFPEIYKTFRNLYECTMDNDNATSYYYFNDEFYNSILEDLKYESQIFWAEVDGKIIAASIILGANGYLNYHLSGSLPEYRHLAPSNLLLYETACWGCENGYKYLHLGGGLGSRRDNLFSFKRAFNRQEPCQFSIGKRIFLEDTYQDLLSMNKNDNDSFFPKYRA